jgi:hypothetical protein
MAERRHSTVPTEDRAEVRHAIITADRAVVAVTAPGIDVRPE